MLKYISVQYPCKNLVLGAEVVKGLVAHTANSRLSFASLGWTAWNQGEQNGPNGRNGPNRSNEWWGHKGFGGSKWKCRLVQHFSVATMFLLWAAPALFLLETAAWADVSWMPYQVFLPPRLLDHRNFQGQERFERCLEKQDIEMTFVGELSHPFVVFCDYCILITGGFLSVQFPLPCPFCAGEWYGHGPLRLREEDGTVRLLGWNPWACILYSPWR